ncbi:hypothetical protein LEN26_020154 [Aphanomyces euteiches]|nr:hypothetical protein LEN26_020154 [Aphanomyces euteiches]KAH9128621.1 hypothetical protein AeMF1_001239 [Aphanomyces euteiches]KAH9191485.1 hypothetical protein AeNC1_006528 [Aphanomyces euteiches]
MSLLDLPIDVISMDEAEDRTFDAALSKVEMDAGALTPDMFRPSHNLVEDGFDDVASDEFGGLPLDHIAFDTLSFYEYGPFSPSASASPSREACMERVDKSFVHNESAEANAKTALPPKYFKTVKSSPQKRRLVSRSINQLKSFSFDASKDDTPPSEASATPAAKTSADEVQIKLEPGIKSEPTEMKTPLRAPRPRATTPPLLAKAASPMFSTPLAPQTTPTKSTPDVSFVSPLAKLTSSTTSLTLVDATTWSGNKTVSLPPRYLQGPNSSPEKKRVHSITFGKSTSFSFSPSKSPKTTLTTSSPVVEKASTAVAALQGAS